MIQDNMNKYPFLAKIGATCSTEYYFTGVQKFSHNPSKKFAL